MILLVTGGSACGKSAYAETRAVRLAQEYGAPLYYLAAMRSDGGEAQKRIARHRVLRAGKGFRTVECPVRVDQVQFVQTPEGAEPERLVQTPARLDRELFVQKPVALLECLSNLLANEMYENGEEELADRLMSQLGTLAEKCAALVIVTNEVFSDGIVYDDWTERYIRYLGELNRRLFCAAREAVEVVYGVPVILKSESI